MANEFVEKLILVLDKEVETYTEVFKLAQEKKDVIINNDVKRLDEITKKEHGFIGVLSKLDSARLTLIGNILYISKVDSVESFDELSNYIDEEFREEYLDKVNSLMEILKELQEINELNNSLIEKSLELVNFNINLFSGNSNEFSNYDKGAGEKANNKSVNFFDHKV